MTAAIYYDPEGYTTKGPQLMGRNAAGESFLRGFLLYTEAHEFWVQVQHSAHAEHFARVAQEAGRRDPVKVIHKNNLAELSQPGVVYYPGPGIGSHAWQRSFHGHGAWSLCGITHTTSSAAAMSALADFIAAPVQPWDALICTSTAVKQNVERVWQAQTDYLQNRLGITRLVLPQCPVIPLGIHSGDFSYTQAQKQQAREQLGVTGDTLVVLFMGRLSFHAKAHPLAMYQALESARKHTGRTVVLVECGWHANDAIAKAYAEAADIACPGIRVVTLDGRQASDRQIAWAGADLFCSLSDNVQETFGIAPIEAMAAGLPVVVSDWDGYKDTVRHGIDGFRIATLMPDAGQGLDLARRYSMDVDSYDQYCGFTSSLVAVDVEAAAAAFVQLFDSLELRQRMGDAGRARAREVYDWRHVIGQYETLWTLLREVRRIQSPALQPPRHPWPGRLDPFFAFAAYPTRQLTPETVLCLADADPASGLQRAQRYRQLAMVNFAAMLLPTDAEIGNVLAAVASGPAPAAVLVQGLPQPRQASVFRGLAWLVKLGILKSPIT